MDIVYFVAPTSRQEELRYSLRSLRLAPAGRVWLVGHRPAWVNPDSTGHISTVQDHENKRENVMRGWLAMLSHPELSDSVVVMNDDFFVMREIAGWPNPNHWRAGYEEWMASGAAWGGQRQKNTLAAMKHLGVPAADRVSAELHVPIVINREAMRDILLILLANGFPRAEISPRSIYVSATSGRAGERIEDVKVHGNERIPRTDFLSTSNGSFSYCWVGKHIRSAHPWASPHELPG